MDWMSENWVWLVPAVGALLVALKKLVKKTKPTWDDKLVAGMDSVWTFVLRKKK